MTDAELITLVGEIDMTRKAELLAAAEAFRAADAADAVVDMSSVTFFGSEGVGFLVRLFMETQVRAGTLTLLNPSDAVLRLISITGLTELVQVRVSVTPDVPVAETSPKGPGRRAVPGLRG